MDRTISIIDGGLTYADLKSCRCGSMPVREARRVMLGRIEDGGYDVMEGRFRCPTCDDGPSWGQCYCVDYGWDKNIAVWNRWVNNG